MTNHGKTGKELGNLVDAAKLSTIAEKKFSNPSDYSLSQVEIPEDNKYS